MKNKYEAKLHIKANSDFVEFIGIVHANSLSSLKEEAKRHARSWNKHVSGRIHVTIEDSDKQFFINP